MQLKKRLLSAGALESLLTAGALESAWRHLCRRCLLAVLQGGTQRQQKAGRATSWRGDYIIEDLVHLLLRQAR